MQKSKGSTFVLVNDPLTHAYQYHISQWSQRVISLTGMTMSHVPFCRSTKIIFHFSKQGSRNDPPPSAAGVPIILFSMPTLGQDTNSRTFSSPPHMTPALSLMIIPGSVPEALLLPSCLPAFLSMLHPSCAGDREGPVLKGHTLLHPPPRRCYRPYSTKGVGTQPPVQFTTTPRAFPAFSTKNPKVQFRRKSCATVTDASTRLFAHCRWRENHLDGFPGECSGGLGHMAAGSDATSTRLQRRLLSYAPTDRLDPATWPRPRLP